jgi:hypothetical protein
MASSEKVQSEQRPEFPKNWQITSDYDPNDHLINLKGKEYLNVQNRLLWFIKDQRSFIEKGLAQASYVIRTELVEMDREAGFAHFKTYVRDVLGNEATMYGSESARDFGDYAEKASTKSLGRALLALGYGTAFAPEMDEGERIVDSPVESRRSSRQARPEPAPQPSSQVAPLAARAPVSSVPSAVADQPATEQQLVSIRKLCAALGKPEPETKLTYGEARQMITQLSGEYQRARRAS